MIFAEQPLDLAQMGRIAIATYLGRFRWRLLDPDEFAQRVMLRLHADPALDAHFVAMQVYNEALYDACSGAEGNDRQHQGYCELYAFLRACVARRYPYTSGDISQQAIEEVFFTFACCRKPEAFMAFALQKLRDAARSEQRAGARRADSLDADGAPEPSVEADVAGEIINHELRRRLRICAREFARRHPRATLQFAAVWLKFIDGLDDQEIARRLGKPVRAIHVLRARGVAKLRLDDQWRALAKEFELPGAA